MTNFYDLLKGHSFSRGRGKRDVWNASEIGRIDYLIALHSSLCPDVPSGLRPTVAASEIWMSRRKESFQGTDFDIFAFFSDMDAKDRKTLGETLEAFASCEPSDSEEYFSHCHDTFVRLTWLHPFLDGNGRTVTIYLNNALSMVGRSLNFEIGNALRLISVSLPVNALARKTMLARDPLRCRKYIDIIDRQERIFANPLFRDIVPGFRELFLGSLGGKPAEKTHDRQRMRMR